MEPKEPIDLCVPIYLNQKIVFDVLAMLEDGFSQLSTIRTSASDMEAEQSGYGGSIGVSNVFALFGISLKGERGKEKGTQEQQDATVEKVHTPASLFSKLRSLLKARSLINKIESLKDIEALESGSFVEFKAVLRKNPLFEYIETFKQILEVADLFPTEIEETQQGGRNKKRKSSGNRQPKNQDTPMYQQIDGIQQALVQNGSLEMIGELLDIPTAKAVLSTNLEYFSDRNASEIIDGEFIVLAKVVRVVEPESKTTINLLRKTAFGRFGSQLFDELDETTTEVEEAGIDLPELVTEIKAPAIQAIPVAIFV